MSGVLETLVLISFITGALVVSSITGLFIDDTFVPDIFESFTLTDEDNNSTSNVTVSSEERQQYLEKLQSRTTKTMIATFVYLALLEVLGLVGNSLVILVYTRKHHLSATQVLIVTISGYDLVAIVIAIPGEVYTILHTWDLNNPIFCRARIFCSAFSSIASGLILVGLAVVRYRKVCHPHKWQITAGNAKVISVAISVLGILFSVPHAILSGRQTRATPRRDIMTYVCGRDDNFKHSKLPLFNYVFLLMLYIVCSLILIGLYILIGITACKHRRLAPSQLVSVTPTPSSRQGSDALEQPSNRDESNCTRDRSPYNKNIDTSITGYTTIQSARNVDDIKMKPFLVANETNEDPVQYNVLIFKERIVILTPTVDTFFVNLYKTKVDKAGPASHEKSHPNNKDNEGTIQKGNSSGDVRRTTGVIMLGINNSDIKIRAIKSFLADIVSNFKYTEMGTDVFFNRMNKLEPSVFSLSKPKNVSAYTFQSKEHSVIIIYDINVHNLNVQDNSRHPPQSIETAENEILNESDPRSMFKCLDVFDCVEHTKCDSNTVRRELSPFVRLPLNKNQNQLQQTEWMRPSVTESMERPDKSTTTNKRRSITFSSTVDRSQAGTSSSIQFRESSTTVTTPSDLKPCFLRRRIGELFFRKVSLITRTMGGYSQYTRPVTRTTTMLFIITAFFILCYLPHLVLMFVKLKAPEVITHSSMLTCTFYNVFARSYFLNCAVNPIIYSLCDEKFRQDCIKVFKNFKR